MKLYFYILQKKCIAAAADIRCEECAVTEKEKSFHPVENFPKGIYRKIIKKTEVGKFIDDLTGSPMVILSEKNDELAKEIFIKQYEEIIRLKRKALKDFEKALDAINEYFSESENENKEKQRKGYLLIDFPAHDCRECQAFGPYNTCGINQKFVDPIPGKLPDWCPIQEVPERKSMGPGKTVIRAAQDEGWNNCLDKLLGNNYE